MSHLRISSYWLLLVGRSAKTTNEHAVWWRGEETRDYFSGGLWGKRESGRQIWRRAAPFAVRE